MAPLWTYKLQELDMPTLPLRYSCVGMSHLCRLGTASVCVSVNDPVSASKGSSKNV
ncbi:unnamed protein product [Dovyalis caffra]|uniref:Uncharacterized protein n=1 Tax=Dovyalis caffra TaxID=77055 RepID=A0AAV1RBZ3_9ROSI|nr:unnamed protein product [Dovyalis caffra]